MTNQTDENTWDSDPRRDVILASIEKMKQHGVASPFEADESFCLPVGERPFTGVLPKHIQYSSFLVAFGIGFWPLISGDTGTDSWIGLKYSLAALAIVLASLLLSTFIIRLRIGSRASIWRKQFSRDHVAFASLACAPSKPNGVHLSQHNPRISHDAPLVLLETCDWGFLFFDVDNRRIIVEGLGARWNIRSSDVESIDEFRVLHRLDRKLSSTEIGFVVKVQLDQNTSICFGAFTTKTNATLTEKNNLLELAELTLQISCDSNDDVLAKDVASTPK